MSMNDNLEDEHNRMNLSGFQFNGEMKFVLLKVADVLIPLQKWINSKPSPNQVPDTEEYLPWRHGKGPLNSEKFNLIQFLEGLLRETSFDLSLMNRWKRLQQAPFSATPIQHPKSWRKARGLEEDAIFGITESRGVLLDKDKNPIIRSEFYQKGTSLLLKAAQFSIPETSGGWEKFVALLVNNSHPSWSPLEFPTSVSFLFQFTRDILYCMMGMRNTAEEPWSTALLVELDETRRVGNHFTSYDTEEAVKLFENVLAKYSNLQEENE
ncbi:hypothetical protein IK7_05613 [Bacillus cereus VD156]|uniref:hypothetical protein n=1 Tax=Bacillus cereus TaxID=1396 RepID=UPI000279BABF|nr:hypothetical protein [Bacillus cereus]EJR74387.1 hypothetical protein IK7_05613 [Bacillus cereus VD156]